MDPELVTHAGRKKLDRVASFRQVQGYSAQLFHVTNGRVDLSFFELPNGYEVRPVAQHETRKTKVGILEDESYIVARLLLITLFVSYNIELKLVLP